VLVEVCLLNCRTLLPIMMALVLSGFIDKTLRIKPVLCSVETD